MISSDDAVREMSVPLPLGTVVDLAPVRDRERPVWLALGEDGTISRWDVATGDHEAVGTTTIAAESDHEPWDGHRLRRSLHASHDGMFAAVVNDYGRFGEVIDLRTGEVTLALDNQGYHQETVPFSLEFARSHGRCVVVHRTAWNRLDVSDAQTGVLLTDRLLPAPADGDAVPEHYLDYFHGALYVSPDGKRILDDGWMWHPVGVPSVWGLDQWIGGNVWESEDGPSRVDVCGRDYYWDHAMTWIDSVRVAVEGLGDDDDVMQPGARIFDTSQTGQGGMPTAVELIAFEGPTGRFFSDGTRLFSCGGSGLSTWDPVEGKLLSVVPGFSPTHHHPGARQFVQLADGVIRLWAA
ncbi:hypothetical protein P3T36_004251 [Kitasatospora sp. MAP12-15]|uniref:hypothetical protein n=1 Tax=unclassified Kitasatospora TaxID=2633591 RepID=UPI002476307A|nr:hypothetical protein [Kitasatospora sp. MAP12-44]MDH6108284.1 hypothetical protein [Kitasatospora sp. MAP12-44]